MFSLLFFIVCISHVTANVTSRISYDDEGVGQALVHRGNVTLPSQVPWHAGIWVPNGPKYDHLCGGTLIAHNLVLTAAHCFWDFQLRRVLPNLTTYKVALGKVYRDWAIDTSNPNIQRMDILRVILDSRFDGYVRRNLENDIALVELTTNATITDYVKPAAVDWTEGPPANGSVGVVAGWGYTEAGQLSHELRSIELPYVDHDSCYQSLGEDKYKKLLTTDKFCAGFINQGKSVCMGDSGGGFVVKNKVTNVPYVRGVVSIDFRPSGSHSDGCYSLHFTGFTDVDVPRYLSWIRKHIPEAPAVPCPPVTASAAVSGVLCDLDREYVNCSQHMPTGTVAVSWCSAGYTAANRTYKVATCLRNGNWSKEEIYCKQVSPCQPSPCGNNSLCSAINGNATCSCLPTYTGSPPSCRNECDVSSDCEVDRACIESKCVNPCLNLTCAPNATCSVVNHQTTCSCQPGYTRDPQVECSPRQVPVHANITANRTVFAVGEAVPLPCIVAGHPPPSVLWYKKDLLLEPSEKIQISESRDLLILQANSSDSGQYRCAAANQYGNSSSSITISVQEVYIHPNCADNAMFANCRIIVQAQYCKHKYYTRFCCKSCTFAGQLPSHGPHLERSSTSA